MTEMASNKEPEQRMDAEAGTTGTDSTAYPSDEEKAEQASIAQGAVGEPDSDHDEVEMVDSGHLEDLERQMVHVSTPALAKFSNLSDPRIDQSRPPKVP
jgi:hypothetical protein